jgi:LuxR family maltose regulon positive regulatory protein
MGGYEVREADRRTPGGEFHDGIVGRPRLARFALRRPALVDDLESATAAQLVVLRGPSGLGKTTLLADWAEKSSERGLHGVWIGIENVESSRQEFWSGVFAALSDAHLAEALPDAPESLRTALLSSLGDRKLVVVFDDFQNAPGDEVADDILWLLRRRSNLSIVISSRVKTALETAAVLASVDTQVIDVSSLLFSRAESAAVLTLRGVSFDMEVGARIHARFGGWPAAINLAATHLVLEGRRVWRESELASVLSTVESELGDELLAEMRDSALWPTLRRSAVLPYLTTDLLEEVLTSREEASELLQSVEDAGLGRWKRIVGQDRFYYVTHIRRSLEASLALDDEAIVMPLRRKVAQAMERVGEPAEAMLQARALGDWGYLSALTSRNYAVLATHHLPQLLNVLDSVPREYQSSDPWLSLLLGVLLNGRDASRVSAAVSMFTRADAVARELSSDAGPIERIRYSVIRIASLRRLGSFGRSVSMADKTIATFKDLNGMAKTEAVPYLADTDVQAGITYLHVGMYAQAERRFAEAHRNASAGAHLRVQAAGYISLMRVLRGEIEESAGWLDNATSRDDWLEWRHTRWAVPAHLAAALLALERFDTETATSHLQTIERVKFDLEDWPLVAYVSGMTHLVAGNGYAGFGAIRDMEGRFARETVSSHFQGLICVVKSDLLLLAKQARAALNALRPFVDGRGSVVGANARALLFSGSDSRALLFAERWAWKEDVSPRTRMELQLVKAIAASRLGDLDNAANSVERAVAIGATNKLQLPWSMVPRDELLNAVARSQSDAEAVINSTARVFAGGLTVPSLTRRESLVMTRLQSSASLEVIARGLNVSPNTVKTQVRSIYRKLGVSSRSEAVRVAFEWRLIGPELSGSDVAVSGVPA